MPPIFLTQYNVGSYPLVHFVYPKSICSSICGVNCSREQLTSEPIAYVQSTGEGQMLPRKLTKETIGCMSSQFPSQMLK